VPTITIASDFDGANADGTAYRNKFSGKYSHRILKGVGHNVPQEAPQAFAAYLSARAWHWAQQDAPREHAAVASER